jgi:multisubunit Na+/H+ antiporter MnhB subunit
VRDARRLVRDGDALQHACRRGDRALRQRFFTGLLFVVYRSPDILLTQVSIEIVSTIFILLILYFMPPFRPDPSSAARRAVSYAVSAAVGAVMFTLVLLSTSGRFRETDNLALDYLTRAKTEAGGANAIKS